MTRRGFAIAAAAGACLLAGVVGSDEARADSHGEKVKCHGVNSCKGQSECATDHSACHGENQCKGKGWIKLTKAECEKAKKEMKKS